MAAINTRQDAGNPDSEERQHGNFDHTDDQHLKPNAANPPPTQLQADAEQKKDQPQLGEKSDHLQIADEWVGQR